MYFFAELKLRGDPSWTPWTPESLFRFTVRGGWWKLHRGGVQRWCPTTGKTYGKTTLCWQKSRSLRCWRNTSLGDFLGDNWMIKMMGFWVMFDPFFSSCSGNGWKRFFIPCCCCQICQVLKVGDLQGEAAAGGGRWVFGRTTWLAGIKRIIWGRWNFRGKKNGGICFANLSCSFFIGVVIWCNFQVMKD